MPQADDPYEASVTILEDGTVLLSTSDGAEVRLIGGSAAVHFSPVQLTVQDVGADSRQLIPADILNQSLDVLLNNVRIPVQLFRPDDADEPIVVNDAE